MIDVRTLSIAEQWLEHAAPVEGAPPPVHDGVPPVHDGASYIDAATVALTFQSLRLGAARAEQLPADEPVTPATLRGAMGCMATGVCVVTTLSDGDDVAMTANSVTSVSLDPPLLLVCIDRHARFHGAIVDSGRWGVSILDATAHAISSACARPNRSRSGQLTDIGHHRGSSGVALLDASVATMECVTESVFPGGDHDIVVGRIVSVARRGEGVHPLLFHQGGYRWL